MMLQQLEPLARLPQRNWRIMPHGDRHLAIAMHTRGGALFWMKWPLSAFPNDLICIEDLEDAGVGALYWSYVATIGQPVVDGADVLLDPAG